MAKISLSKAIPAAAPEPEHRPTRRWWVGTLPGAPKKDVTLAGISFNFRTGDYNGVGGQPGAVVELTEETEQRIIQALGTKVARFAPGGGTVLDTRVKGYTADAKDKPLADYVYMIPENIAARVVGAPQFRDAVPPSLSTMLARGEDEADWFVPEPEVVTVDQAAALKSELQAREREVADLKRKLAAKPKDPPKMPATQNPPAGGADPAADGDGEPAKDPGYDAEERARTLGEYTVPELTEYAKTAGVDLAGKGKKVEIIQAIIDAGK